MKKTYRLKPGVESFDVVDGPFAGRQFVKGLSYTQIPPEEKHKFEEIQGPGVRDALKKADVPAAKPSPRTVPRPAKPLTNEKED
ncbi:MAG: hypothetical protein JRJ54_05825 [Deltaproteobacteria bacterium]|nr:hypothetical protein [Deltaproteobacteria bacterium]